MSAPETAQIVTAGRIAAMAGAEPPAFAIRGERVVAHGSVADLRREFRSAEVHDFGSATVVPGFNDAHQHATICAAQSLQVDLSPARIRSTADLETALRAQAAATPRGDWIIGCGYDPFRSNGGRDLTRAELDAACPDHPVLVVHVTLHAGAVNSAGLALAGFTDTSEPPPGGHLGRDAAGRLDGVVHDQALYDLAFPAFTPNPTVIAEPDTATLAAAFTRHARELHAAGITSIGEALVGPTEWRTLSHLCEQGQLTLRVNALAAYDHFDYFRAQAEPGPRLRLGGVKTFADGAVNGGTCLVEQPIEGTDSHGLERVTAAELTDIVRHVHDAGWRACVHANGDRAIRRVLDAVEQAQTARPRPDPRHRIEHCSIIDDEILSRMRALGMVAVPFANYAAAHGDKLAQFYGAERVERMFAHRSMLEAGVAVAGSSDHPCGPFEPLFALRSCVTRRAPDGNLFGPSQRIPVEAALGLYTTGAAYASGEEAVKGQLAPGFLADFAVLGEDPFTADPERLDRVPVRETWVGGERVWP
ncbi:amidohydrolase [Amycolatopsis benzoatilytica]|uniref:amidohydrolase n=1 Tax=Amycolatopsis benzoatilytica TaxID=346045 RepID=UPI00036D8FF9|nr:amidohydrolase [Amycolatopsis benzoatilytica]